MKRKTATSRPDESPLYAATTQPDTTIGTSFSILSTPNPNATSFSDLPWQIFAATETDASLSHSMTISSTAEISQERVPQHQPHWGDQETKELISIRAEVERGFAASKRSNNRTLWEIVSKKMLERGFIRSPDQCKCKWKNLVNRYKGKETSDPGNGRQCPFFEELNAVFMEREKNIHRLLLESEAGASKVRKRVKKVSGDGSSDDFSDDEYEDAENSEDEKPTRSNLRRRKGEKTALGKIPKADNAARAPGSPVGDVQEILKQFLQQQQRIEMQWTEMMNRRAHERQLFEEEWRQSMEKLERERLLTEQAWREREEQRRRREESRAERRDALLTTLLDKLMHENNT